MTDLWRGEWGDAYQDRNPCTEQEIARRIIMWRKVLSVMSMEDAPKSFLEVGAGAGANLRAIQAIYEHNKIKARLHGVEPNAKAEHALLDNFGAITLREDASNICIPDNDVDMAYTYGVLIHIPDSELEQSMSEIYRVSKKWIFCAEYFAPETVEVPYRDKRDALWKRPYGDLWLDRFDLQIVAYGFEWKRVSGLDNVTWWLMRKT